jgi:hypothetical protein
MEQYVNGRLSPFRNRAIFFLVITLCCMAILLGIYSPALPTRALRESVNQSARHRIACSPSQNDQETMQALTDNENQTQGANTDVIANQTKQQNHIMLSAYEDSAITVTFQDISPTAKRRRIGSSQ